MRVAKSQTRCAPGLWDSARQEIGAGGAAPTRATSSLGYDERRGLAYAQASAAPAKSGEPVDAADLWIGATAIAHGLDLLALYGDFDPIPGISRLHIG